IQRPLKHAIRQAQQEDLVAEARKAIEENRRRTAAGLEPVPFRFDTKLGTLRDRSIRWLVVAHNAVNRPALVKQAFELCCVGDDKSMNLSQESLRSARALDLIEELQSQNPAVWVKTSVNTTADSILNDLPSAQDQSPFHDDPENIDDVAVPFEDVVRWIASPAA
ncbi:hypothetical protein BV20DRAFT_930347, partial [Pilatotrama ljubarskyi]